MRVAVVVLEALAHQRRPARRGAEEEAAAARVAEGPDLVTGPLEAEHRVEDVERDHRHAVRRVGRAGGLERGHRARLGDPLLEHLAVGRLAVREHEVRVDRFVPLPERRVDPDLLEQRVHAERARLVGDDRHDPLAELRVAQQVAQQRAKTIVVLTAMSGAFGNSAVTSVPDGRQRARHGRSAAAAARPARGAARRGTGSPPSPCRGGSTAHP